MRSILMIMLFLIGTFSGLSQIGVGEWRMHISPYQATDLVEGDGVVFTIYEKGMLEYDLETGEKTVWSAGDYLSDVSPTALAFHGPSKRLIIGYDNGNIDFLRGAKIENFPYLYKSSISGNKHVNRIVVDQDFAYVATEIGIIVVDLIKKEVKDTYHPIIGNVSFLDVAFLENKIYVLTENAVYEADKNNPFLADPSQWTALSDVQDYTAYGYYKELETYNNQLILSFRNTTFSNSDTLFYIENGTPIAFDSLETYYGINGEGDDLLVACYGHLLIFSSELVEDDVIYQYGDGQSMFPRNASYIDGYYFIADEQNGLVRSINSWSYTMLGFEGPRYNSVYRAQWRNGKLSIANGGFTGTNPSFTLDGGAVFEGEKWQNIIIADQEMLEGNRTWDFIGTSIHPHDNEVVAYSTASGVSVIITEKGIVTDTFTIHNSLIEELSTTGWGIVSDIQYDDDGNLWIANYSANRPLKVLSKEGVWYDFEPAASAKGKRSKRMVIDKNGVKWIAFRDAGLMAFDEGESFEDTSDDRFKMFNTGDASGALPSNDVETIAVDIDNNIWIGTPEGMRVLYNTEAVFDADPGKYNFQKLLIEYGENVEIVLGTTHITSIMVDGGNRKWIGTANSGVFLLSPDGLDVLNNFTTENSPLLSNTVYDIAINHNNGEVFFLTEDGLISYRSDASQGDSEYTEVIVFPNPVLPDYHGPITIQGIAYDSDVKITDVSGRLVYKTKSNGGTATWDGKRMDGSRASTGVYLIWTSIDDHDFKGRKVGKVLVID